MRLTFCQYCIIFFFLKAVQGLAVTPEMMCRVHTDYFEYREKIPAQLLTAISITESGRMVNKKFSAWPWSVNAGGKTYFYPTKEAAIQAIKDFQKNGLKSIDVGCMQINLQHHPKAFRDLSEALDPRSNVAYGAAFLKKLKTRIPGRDWLQAATFYHSANPIFQKDYLAQVTKNWQTTRKNTQTRWAHNLATLRTRLNNAKPRIVLFNRSIPRVTYAMVQQKNPIKFSKPTSPKGKSQYLSIPVRRILPLNSSKIGTKRSYRGQLSLPAQKPVAG